jgi:hypothetical protein
MVGRASLVGEGQEQEHPGVWEAAGSLGRCHQTRERPRTSHPEDSG